MAGERQITPFNLVTSFRRDKSCAITACPMDPFLRDVAGAKTVDEAAGMVTSPSLFVIDLIPGASFRVRCSEAGSNCGNAIVENKIIHFPVTSGREILPAEKAIEDLALGVESPFTGDVLLSQGLEQIRRKGTPTSEDLATEINV